MRPDKAPWCRKVSFRSQEVGAKFGKKFLILEFLGQASRGFSYIAVKWASRGDVNYQNQKGVLSSTLTYEVNSE